MREKREKLVREKREKLVRERKEKEGRKQGNYLHSFLSPHFVSKTVFLPFLLIEKFFLLSKREKGKKRKKGERDFPFSDNGLEFETGRGKK